MGDNGEMDQGISALGASLVAAAGGLAAAFYAARMSRMGAQIAAGATRAQVHDQGALTHLQWVRTQRQQSYERMLDAYAAFDSHVQSSISDILHEPDQEILRAHIFTSRKLLIELSSQSSRLRLWGPNKVATAAIILASRSSTVVAHLTSAVNAVEEEQHTMISRFRTTMEKLHDERKSAEEAHASFIFAAGETLRNSSTLRVD